MNCSENTLWDWDQYILDYYIPLCNQQIDLLLLSLWYRHRCLLPVFATSKVRGPVHLPPIDRLKSIYGR